MTDTTILFPATAGDAGAESSRSAVSWAAIIAGGVTAAAVSLILLILGAGLGLSTLSPWSNSGASATAIGVGAIIWLIVTQWIAAGLGGYLTGRLRTKWVSVHTHEVFFRDTAHGFLAWALATVISAAFLASAVSAIVGGTATAATTVLSGAAQGAAQSSGSLPASPAYFVDMLFRPNPNAPAATPPTQGDRASDIRAETGRILVTALGANEVNPADRTYVAQLVAARTGLSQADAEKRVDDVIAQARAVAEKAKQVADQARKAAATLAIFSFLALLVGAFIASAAAALGGRERDELEIAYSAR